MHRRQLFPMRTTFGSVAASTCVMLLSCASSKELNERSGVKLLQEKLSDAYYPVSLGAVTPLMIRTQDEYGKLADFYRGKGVQQDAPIMVASRLLEKGYVTEEIENGDVRWYTYSFGPKLRQLMIKMNSGAGPFSLASVDGVKAGTYKVEQISDLQLVIETAATASFDWNVQLNEIGEMLLSRGNKPAGKGKVEFAKKPDGSWIVSSWCTIGCIL